MKKNPLLFIGLVLAIVFATYWFFLRPTQIRNTCVERARERTNAPGEVSAGFINNTYRACLAEHGLKPENLLE